jgi:hypothetical protein
MKMKAFVHWNYDKELETSLLNSSQKTSVCIDTDKAAEALLRLTLNRLNVSISDQLSMIIHCWSIQDLNDRHYYFINDQQNNLIKEGFQTACIKP